MTLSLIHISQAAPEPEKVFDMVEQMPTFPGGQTELMAYMGKNIKYPTIAQENGTQGSVIIPVSYTHLPNQCCYGNIGVVGPRCRKKFSEKNSLENETIDGDSPVFEAK